MKNCSFQFKKLELGKILTHLIHDHKKIADERAFNVSRFIHFFLNQLEQN